MKKRPYAKLFATNTALHIVVLFVLSMMALLIKDNRIMFAIMFGTWIAITVYSFVYETKKEKELLDYIMTLSFDAGHNGRDLLLRLPLPITVLRMDGSVVWYNEHFRKKFQLSGVFDINISEVVGDENTVKNFFEPQSDEVKVTVGGNTFSVVVNITRSEGGEVVAILYWIDETRYVRLKELYESSRPVICELTVDNYDEVIHNTPENLRTILVGTIEQKVSDWINSTGGIFKKTERDRYFIIFEKQYLQKIIDSKFSVLEAVHNINIGNKLPPTVSLGIGVDGDTFGDNLQFAHTALDMALGRGGDQAVIKDKNKFAYFGGSNQETEKYTRVKTRVMAFALKQLISQSEKIFIMGHKNADLDSFGASVGMLSAAVNAGKEAYIVLETKNEFTIKLLKQIGDAEPIKNRIIPRKIANEYITPDSLVIVVDVYRPVITEAPELLESADNIVVIDHHRKSSEFIENTSLVYHEPAASSASEMVTELLQYIDEKAITSDVAHALYAGIKLDTKDFCFKTGVRTFEAAAYLRRKGVNVQSVKLLFQNDRTVYSLLSGMVNRSEIYRESIAISKIDSDYHDLQSISAAAADELLSIEGIEASFTMCRINGRVYISGRSIGSINVQFILEKVGGGGHGVVAGAQLECSFKEAESMLKEAIDAYFEGQSEDISEEGENL